MKTTFDIPQPLLHEIQSLARERRTTTKSLVEQALIALLDSARSTEAFQLRDVTFQGDTGLTPDFEHASWDQVRDEIYRGRGA